MVLETFVPIFHAILILTQRKSTTQFNSIMSLHMWTLTIQKTKLMRVNCCMAYKGDFVFDGTNLHYHSIWIVDSYIWQALYRDGGYLEHSTDRE